jgi:hypothetical protein
MNDTDNETHWKPIDQELLEESAQKGKVEKITLKEIEYNEFIIEVELSWRTEPSRLCLKRNKSKPRTFKNLDRLKIYLEESKFNHLKIALELKSEGGTE